MAKQMKSSQIMLQRDFINLTTKPKSEFFTVYGIANDNIQEWIVYIIGPPDTLYEKGVYKAIMRFPDEYPIKPPTLQFQCEIFHPNIYKDGKVCISTLQTGPDGADKGQYWRPILGVEQALLSVVSLLSDPNNDDPANTTAANMYKSDMDAFREKCRVFAEKSLELLPDDFEYPVVKKETESAKKDVQQRRGLRLELDDDSPSASNSYVEDDDSDWEPEYDPEDMSDGGYSDSDDEEKESCSPNNLNKKQDDEDDDDDAEASFPGSKKNRNSILYSSKKKSENGKSSTSKDAENSQNNNTNTSSSESQKDNIAPISSFRQQFQITDSSWFNRDNLSLSEWEDVCDGNSATYSNYNTPGARANNHSTNVKRSSLLRRSLGRVTKFLSV